MIVPLSAKRARSKYNQELVIWANDERKVVRAPFKPYFYSLNAVNTTADIERVEGIQLSTFQKRVFYRHNFNLVDEVPQQRIEGQTFEDNIPFVFRVRTDEPDYYLKYPNTDELRFLFLDIEQSSEPGAFFPTFNDPITNICYCTQKNRKLQKLEINKSSFNSKGKKADMDMLQYFNDVVKEEEPNVYVYYNKSYDIPTILRRCDRLGLDTRVYSRDKSRPYIGGKDNIKIEGTIIYDPYVDAAGDQSLNGEVQNRGLKEVSRQLGFKTNIPVVDTTDINSIIGTPELREYNADDVRRLLLIFDTYFNNVYTSAEQLQLPLDTTIGLETTDLGITLLGEEFVKKKIIADGDNRERFPDIFLRPEVLNKKVAAFQGALSNIKKFGTFNFVKKADYKSMYPNIMATFNLSHDTCWIVDKLPYNKDGFEIVTHSDSFDYIIPDDKIKKNVVIRVAKEQGISTRILNTILENKDKYNRRYSQTKDNRDKALKWIEKVKANGIYGIQGSPAHPYGHVPIAIGTTGIGREGVKTLIMTLEDIYPGCVIEWDTDGVYFDMDDYNFDEVDVWTQFDRNIEEKFKRRIFLDIEFEKYDQGYFYKTKNYILRRKDVFIFHGVSMKNSGMCNIERNLIQELGRAKLGLLDEKEVIKKYRNLSNFEYKDFVLSKQQQKSLKNYIGHPLIKKLAVAAQYEIKQEPEIGNQYYYVKTHSGYELYQSANKNALDYTYYTNIVEDVIKKFTITGANYKYLDAFYGKSNKTGTDEYEFDEEEVTVSKQVKEESKIVGLDKFY